MLIHTSQAQNCEESTSQTELNINNIRATMLGGGDMWSTLDAAGYIAPNPEPGNPEIAALYTASLWVGGYDAAGNLKLAAQTYRQSGNDYWSGPISQDGTTDYTSCQNWDRHWTVYGADIAAHRADYDDNQQIDNTVPDALLEWPGENNPQFQALNGFVLPPNEYFAPYVDVNADGIYNPYDGDYPDIKDSDQGIWWVYNDVGNIHTETGADQIGLQISVLAYASAGTADNPVLDNTTFYEFSILSKASAIIYDTRIGLFVDLNLGCWTDDYVGCDIDRNMGYVYNSADVDPYCGGLPGYGTKIPVLGIRILDGPSDQNGNEMEMSKFVTYNNNTIQPVIDARTNPTETSHYYGYMSGFWKDGTPIQYGGDGYDEGTAATSFMYPSNPANTSSDSWSECSVGSPPRDRRMVISVGPFDMTPGYQDKITYAVIWVPNVEHPCPDISVLQQVSDIIAGTVTSTHHPTVDDFQVNLAPHPMKDKTLLTVSSNEIVQHIRIYAADGRLHRNYEKPDSQLLIERGNLSAGIYFYEIKLKNGQMKGGKLVVDP